MKHLKVYVGILFLLCSLASLGQRQYQLEQFTLKEGLPSSFIYDVYQDRKGLIWICTNNGLSSFDGYSFRNYQYKPLDSLSLSSKEVRTIYQDIDGNYWVACNTDFGRFYPASGRFEKVLTSNKQSAVYVTNIIQNNDKEILLTGERFHYNYFIQTGILRQLSMVYTSNEMNLGDDIVQKNVGVFDDLDRKVRSTVFTGQFRWANKIIHDLDKVSFYIDSKKRLWTCSEKENIIKVFNTDGKALLTQQSAFTDKSLYFVLDFEEDADGNIWMATQSCVLCWNEKEQKVIKYDKINSTTALIRTSRILIDKTGLVWIATLGEGLCRLDPRSYYFNYFKSSAVGGIFPHKQNNLLISLERGRKLLVMDEFSKKKVQFELSQLIDPQYSYLATSGILHKDSSKFLAYLENNPYPSPLGYDYFLDKKKTLYQVFYNYVFIKSRSIIIDSVQLVNWRQSGDTVWLCNIDYGLIAYNTNTNKLTRFITTPNREKSISSNSVYDVVFEKSGNLWIATDYGLNYFDIRTGSFTHYAEKDGLSNHTIFSMTADSIGNLWLGTNSGLSCFIIAKKKFINFSSGTVINTECNRFSAYTSPAGIVYMGGMDGVDYFNPRDIDLNINYSSSAFIVNVTIGDSAIIPQNGLVFKHGQNNLNISFASDDYRNSPSKIFLCTLKGEIESTQLLKGINNISFYNLLPGSYTFSVKEISADSNASIIHKAGMITFSIRPAWYQSIIIKLVAASCLLLIIIWIVRLYYLKKLQRQRHVFEKQMELQSERLRISSELHDDIGGGLSTIKLMTEMAKDPKFSLGSAYLESIAEKSKELVQNMNEIVWSLNINNDTFTGLVTYIREYAAKYLDNAGIILEFTPPETVDSREVTGSSLRNIFLLVKESLHNVVKHSGASKVLIDIRLGNQLTIGIADNGMGLNNESSLSNYTGNGFVNMRLRINALKGVMEVSNQQGLLLLFSIPLSSLYNKSVNNKG